MAYSLPLLTFNILFSTKSAERKIRGVCEIQDWKDFFKENKGYGEGARFWGKIFRLDLEETDQLQYDIGYQRQSNI